MSDVHLLQGRRIEPVDSHAPRFDAFEVGDYCLMPDGELWFRDPEGKLGRVVTHTITEHEDRTVTVSPSIMCVGEGTWHGYLERGMWRTV